MLQIHKRRKTTYSGCGQTASCTAQSDDSIQLDRFGDSLELVCAALLDDEQTGDQSMDGGGDNHRVWGGGRLHSRGYVRSIAEDFRIAARTFANHDGTAIDPDTNRQSRTAALPIALIESPDRVNYRESRARGAFGVVVVRFGPSEVRHDAIAKVLSYKAVEAGDRFGHGAEIVSFDFAPLLRIELRRNLHRADQVTKQNGQMAAFTRDLAQLDWRRLGYRSANRCTKRSAAFTAKPCCRRIARAAMRTGARKQGPAFRAELPAFRTLDPEA